MPPSWMTAKSRFWRTPRVEGTTGAELALGIALVEVLTDALDDHELEELHEVVLCDVEVGVHVLVGVQVVVAWVDVGFWLVVLGAPEPKSHEPYTSPCPSDAKFWNKEGERSRAPYGHVGH